MTSEEQNNLKINAKMHLLFGLLIQNLPVNVEEPYGKIPLYPMHPLNFHQIIIRENQKCIYTFSLLC